MSVSLAVRKGRTVRGPSPWALGALVLAGSLGVVVVVALALVNGDLVRPGLQAFLVSWIVVPYLISGVVAWSRRPASRLGPLMIATSFAMMLTALQWSSVTVLASLGHLADMLPAALFVHVFLSFPTGRLESRSSQAVVLACYGVTVVLQVVKVALGVNPDNLLAVAVNNALANQIERVQLAAMSALLLISAVLLLVRARAVGRPRRAPAMLLVDAFGLAPVMLSVLYLMGLLGSPYLEEVRNITFITLGLAPIAFLWGLLDARLARTAVGELLVELRAHPTGDLREPLARALHDPSLRIAYWLPRYGVWADQDGRTVTLRGPEDGRATRAVHRNHEPVLVLEFDQSLADEQQLVDEVATAVGIALENTQLHADLRARLHELQVSRARLIGAGQQERQQLERNLHDGAQQRLVALALELGLIADGSESSDETRARLMQAKRQVAVSLDELRDLAHGLHPAVVTGHGLAVALESLVAEAAVPVVLKVAVDGRLPEHVEVAAYYVISESLANIGKHASARNATVDLDVVAGSLVVAVTDDGSGGPDSQRGSGLRGLTDRVEALGGNLGIQSPVGGGTRLEARIPCG